MKVVVHFNPGLLTQSLDPLNFFNPICSDPSTLHNISTPDFQPFSIPKSVIEESMVEKFGVEKSLIENFGVEMSYYHFEVVFKTWVNFHDFWPLTPSVGKFGHFLTPPSLKLPTSKNGWSLIMLLLFNEIFSVFECDISFKKVWVQLWIFLSRYFVKLL